jgi:uncharacterized protein involved in high-affinity Fe2+ transport
MRLMLAGFVAVSSMACVELPEGFEDATPIDVVQHECSGAAEAPVNSTLMAAITNDNEVSGTLLDASFLCSTEVCGYAVEVDGVARVLFQPCDMHPSQEALCSCASDIDFVAPFAADVEVSTAEAWSRGAHVDDDAALLDSVDL